MAAGAGGDATQRNRHVVPGPGTRVDTSPAPVIPAAALDRIASHGGEKKGGAGGSRRRAHGCAVWGRVAAPRDGTWWSRRGAGARRGWLWRGVRRFIGPVRALRCGGGRRRCRRGAPARRCWRSSCSRPVLVSCLTVRRGSSTCAAPGRVQFRRSSSPVWRAALSRGPAARGGLHVCGGRGPASAGQVPWPCRRPRTTPCGRDAHRSRNTYQLLHYSVRKRARVRYPHLHAWSSFLSRPITGPVVPPRTPAARATQVESNTWFKVVSVHLSGALNLAAEACEPGQTATGLCGKFGNPAKHGVR